MNLYRSNDRGFAMRLGIAAALLVISGQTWAQEQLPKLLASNAEAGAAFGQSVSVSVETAIIGAPFHDVGVNANAGEACIFQKDFDTSGEWGEVKILKDGTGAENDKFGTSVAISGDIAIVGAPEDNHGGSNLGTVFVFYRDEGGIDNWGEVTSITASDGDPNDEFGYSVSISGDIAIVGAPYVGNDVGAAYVFYRDEGGTDNWGEVAIVSADDGANGDVFGWTVSISGDYAVVGAPLDDDTANVSGSAYVFYRHEGGNNDWGQVAKLTASDAAECDNFAISVAISANFVVVGAWGDDDEGGNSGSAYVYEQPVGGWDDSDQWDAKLHADDAVAGDYFGISVSIRGERAIVGAFGDDGARGAAYVFDSNDDWDQTTKLTADDDDLSDVFGRSVGISGDFAISGAPGDDEEGSAAGAAYVFESVCPCPWDLNNSGHVDAADLIELLGAWGTDPGGPPDFDGDGDVDAFDLLDLLGAWGACPCVEEFEEPPTLQELFEDACLTWPDDWNATKDALGTSEQDNYLCWLDHYLNHCTNCFCPHGGSTECSGDDPFN